MISIDNIFKALPRLTTLCVNLGAPIKQVQFADRLYTMENFSNTNDQLPYNPNDVDIRQQTFSVDYLISMVHHSEIELWREIDYQRKSNAWGPKQKSRLIESLIMRIPLPIFYFDGSERPWKVVDGLHRLTTLYSFIVQGSFELNDLEFLKDLECKTFSQMPFRYQRAILESAVEAYVINPGTPDKVKLNIFQRINTGGSSLTRQEIRNAYYRGKPTKYIDFLANANEFLLATNHKIKPTKMKDKEAVLRFFAFYNFLEKYNSPMERFLDFSMENIEYLEERELDDIGSRFKMSMMTCHAIFKERAFFVLNIHGEKQSTNINIALFESWTVNLAHLDSIDHCTLIGNYLEVINKFTILLQDVDFSKSFSSNTSSKKAVFTRFSAIKHLINSILNAD